MDDPTTIMAQALRQTLMANIAYAAALPKATYWHRAPDGQATPYVTMYYIRGGDQHTAGIQMIDMQVRVCATTNSAETARNLSNLIFDALQNKDPVTTGLSYDGYGTIYQIMPYWDEKMVQNTTFFISGGLYRIRLVLRS